MKIWVDDVRLPPEGWLWCTDSDRAILWLQRSRHRGEKIEAMSLDHDLGGEDTTRLVVLWMIENNFWPDKVIVHSANPVGREWLEGMIERYK